MEGFLRFWVGVGVEDLLGIDDVACFLGYENDDDGIDGNYFFILSFLNCYNLCIYKYNNHNHNHDNDNDRCI